MTKAKAITRGVAVVGEARAMAISNPEGAAALLRTHGMGEAAIEEVLRGGGEAVPCEFCETVVPVTDARSVDDFWVCAKCITRETKP